MLLSSVTQELILLHCLAWREMWTTVVGLASCGIGAPEEGDVDYSGGAGQLWDRNPKQA